MTEKQELYCHNCGKYVQFDIDMELNGNHVLKCPNCGHEHCRVVKDGVITDDRWDSRNPTYIISKAAYTSVSTWNTYNGSSSNMILNSTSTTTPQVSKNSTFNATAATMFTYQLWMNSYS
jgi:DNA-directed RNA polymerase subunit RPC12/RpoP